jgi:hypothetical protein
VYLSKFVDSFENSFLILDCFSLIFWNLNLRHEED